MPGNADCARRGAAFTRPLAIATQPPGAKVFWREYERQDAAWEYLGTTPLQLFFPFGAHRMRFELDGYRPYEAAPSFGLFDPFPLDRLGSIPDSLVHVPGGHFGPGPEDEEIELPGYLIDRFEVTNRRYQAFVDAGGYLRPELWREAFVENGRRVSFQEAMSRFTDRTGRPGPSTWQMGDPSSGAGGLPGQRSQLVRGSGVRRLRGTGAPHRLSLEAGRLGRGRPRARSSPRATSRTRACTRGAVPGHERVRRTRHGRQRPRVVLQRGRGSPIRPVHPRRRLGRSHVRVHRSGHPASLGPVRRRTASGSSPTPSRARTSTSPEARSRDPVPETGITRPRRPRPTPSSGSTSGCTRTTGSR